MENEKIISNRSEILFLYDILDANPNGDPLDGNKPRLDEDTEINLVTDTRLKRTIRDYLKDVKSYEIFIKEKKDSEGHFQTIKSRIEDFIDENTVKKGFESIDDAKKYILNTIIEECIDVRLFGATIAPKKYQIPVLDKKDKNKTKLVDFGSINLTGPVQFRMGRSLNKVDIIHIKGTGAFASDEGKFQKTFREEYIVPYSLISFYGIINENVAQDTKLTNDDVSLLIEGIWNGTKNLITRSKFGQMPRFLLQIEYGGNNFFIGDLNNKISIGEKINDKSIRNIGEVELDISQLINSIEKHSNKINKIYYKFDENIKFRDLDFDDLKEKFSKIEFVELKF